MEKNIIDLTDLPKESQKFQNSMIPFVHPQNLCHYFMTYHYKIEVTVVPFKKVDKVNMAHMTKEAIFHLIEKPETGSLKVNKSDGVSMEQRVHLMLKHLQHLEFQVNKDLCSNPSMLGNFTSKFITYGGTYPPGHHHKCLISMASGHEGLSEFSWALAYSLGSELYLVDGSCYIDLVPIEQEDYATLIHNKFTEFPLYSLTVSTSSSSNPSSPKKRPRLLGLF